MKFTLKFHYMYTFAKPLSLHLLLSVITLSKLNLKEDKCKKGPLGPNFASTNTKSMNRSINPAPLSQ